MSQGFSLNPTIAPSSSTGSDLHDIQTSIDFGNKSVGGGGDQHWAMKMARDVGVAILAGIAIKHILGRK